QVSTEKNSIAVEGIKREKLKGGNVDIYIHTSNVMITGMNLDDKWRQNRLEKQKTKIPKEKPQEKPVKTKEPSKEKTTKPTKETIKETLKEKPKSTKKETKQTKAVKPAKKENK
ncbi:MAG: 60S ribosomal protein L26, partial [Nitrosopumilaceae archaeon]